MFSDKARLTVAAVSAWPYEEGNQWNWVRLAFHGLRWPRRRAAAPGPSARRSLRDLVSATWTSTSPSGRVHLAARTEPVDSQPLDP